MHTPLVDMFWLDAFWKVTIPSIGGVKFYFYIFYLLYESLGYIYTYTNKLMLKIFTLFLSSNFTIRLICYIISTFEVCPSLGTIVY